MAAGQKIFQFKPYWGDEERKAVRDVLAGDFLNEGEKVREFERRFAEFVGARYCIMVPNGAIALSLSLKVHAPGIIQVPDNYGIFVANAASAHGHDVVIKDVGKNGSMEESPLLHFVVHANGRLGHAMDYEDSCQAISHHTKGCISSYSFHPTKQMTCGGIGGAVCCDDEALYAVLSAIKDHGRPERALGKPVTDSHKYVGTNYKMAEVNAAFGIEQLKKLPWRLSRLAKMHSIYQELLGDTVSWIEGVPQWQIDCLVPDPEMLVGRLAKAGIGARRYYKPVHLQEQYRDGRSFPVAENLYLHGVYLPSTTDLTDEDLQLVCSKVRECLSQ